MKYLIFVFLFACATSPESKKEPAQSACKEEWYDWELSKDSKIRVRSNLDPHQIPKLYSTPDLAIILIHGYYRKPDVHLHALLEGLKFQGKNCDNTWIIAPEFSKELWKGEAWKAGGFDKSGQWGSFQVVDHIIASLPKKIKIVIAGHSAGGQFVNRYAFFSSSPRSFTSILANPSTYLYLSSQRPVPEDELCPGYDRYRYGIADTPKHLLGSHSIQSLKNRFWRRNVVYLLGDQDNDPKDPLLDIACEAKLQGHHRFERGLFYRDHLKKTSSGLSARTHVFHILKGIGHSHEGVFASQEFSEALRIP